MLRKELLWLAMRSRNREWSRAVLLLVLLAELLASRGERPPERRWVLPRAAPARGRRGAWRASVTGRRPRG